MKRLVYILVFILFALLSYSQDRTSIGVRVGNFVGLDVKHFFSNNRDFSAQLHLNQKPKSAERGELTRIQPMLVYQQRLRFKRLPYKVFFFYGGGAHYGISKRYHKPGNDVAVDEYVNSSETGIDATIGLELKSRKIPITFAIDFSPYYNFKDVVDDNQWLNMGVAVRYRLGPN